MAANLPSENISQLKSFVQLCESNPAILHKPELSFFKQWIERYATEQIIVTVDHHAPHLGIHIQPWCCSS